jgi:hypothetical protein
LIWNWYKNEVTKAAFVSMMLLAAFVFVQVLTEDQHG